MIVKKSIILVNTVITSFMTISFVIALIIKTVLTSVDKYPIVNSDERTLLLIFSLITAAYGLLGSFVGSIKSIIAYRERDAQYTNTNRILAYGTIIMLSCSLILASIMWNIAYYSTLVLCIQGFTLTFSSICWSEYHKKMNIILSFVAVIANGIATYFILDGGDMLNNHYWIMIYIFPTTCAVRIVQLKYYYRFLQYIRDSEMMYSLAWRILVITCGIFVWPGIVGFAIVVAPFAAMQYYCCIRPHTNDRNRVEIISLE